jgi:glucokinase
VEEAARQAEVEWSAVAGLGVGVATVLDQDGRLTAVPNLGNLGGMDLRGYLQEVRSRPAVVHNDASCFAVGEWWTGAGKGSRNLCAITLGTGMGIGLVVEGRLYEGSHGYAGEIWTTPMEGTFLEDLVCAGAIERHYEGLSGRRLSGVEVAGLADEGEAHALSAFTEFGRSVGVVVSFIVNLLDPDVVVFGGAISRSARHFMPGVREALLTTTTTRDRAQLEVSALGETAALLGAARLLWEALQ